MFTCLFTGFFEDLAAEAKIDPDKPVVVKNAIHARKTMTRRAKNKKFERRKSNSKYRVIFLVFII